MKELKRFLNKKTLALFLVAALACAPVNAITSQAEPYQGGFTDTSEYPNLTYAECVYQNVSVEAGGTASKVTDTTQQKYVVDQVKRLNDASVRTYSNREYYNEKAKLIKEKGANTVYAQKNKPIVLQTKEEAQSYGITGYDFDKLNYPLSVVYYTSSRYDFSTMTGYYSDGDEGEMTASQFPGSVIWVNANVDDNKDEVVTYAEEFGFGIIVDYDSEKGKAILEMNPNVFYAFNLSGASENTSIHIESDRNIDNWTKHTNDYNYSYYDYKYGNTQLYVRENEDGTLYWGNSNVVDDKGHVLVALTHYNENTNSWERIPGYYKPDQMGTFNAKLAGDGLYIATVFDLRGERVLSQEELVDVSEYEKAAGPVAGTTSNSGQTSASALVPFEDGNWYLFTDGKFNSAYTGLFYDQNVGWWLVQNGRVAFEYNDLYYDANLGWWKVTNGSVDFGYTGLWYSPIFGWWYVQNGAVSFSYTGLVANESGWWYVQNGAINFNYTGLVCDPYVGWWFVENGAINFNATGLVANEYGWWYVQNGTINFAYNGLVANDYGWWYVQNGAINFNYNGLAYDPYVGWWVVNNGAINFGYTGMIANEYGWWYAVNGALDLGATGWACNDYGWWLYYNGTIAFNYTGWWGDYYCVNGHLA